MAAKPLRVCSVSMSMPTTLRPRNGVFVRRRLSALGKISDLQAIMPSPWFPGLSPVEHPATDIGFPIQSRRMFYLPKVLKNLDRFWMRRSILPIIRQLHRQQSFDLLDAHFGYPTGAACCDIGQALDIPTFVTIRGVEQRQLKDPRIGPQLFRSLQQARGIIAVSHSLKASVAEAGIDPDKVKVVPNAVDTTSFFPGEQGTEREALGLAGQRRLIVSVGSMIRRKGYHDLLNAFAQIRPQFPDAMLAIVGGGVSYDRAYPHQIESQVRNLNLQDSVRLVGSIPPQEVPHWLRAADVFALATYQEGCCNGVLEALASGLPAVVTPAGDNERYIESGKNGFVFDIGQPEQLAQRLKDALIQDWDHTEIARGVSQYGWDDVAESVRQFYHCRLA